MKRKEIAKSNIVDVESMTVAIAYLKATHLAQPGQSPG
jgi:hypothetical protein